MDVQVLPGHDLGAHRGEDLPCGRGRVRGDARGGVGEELFREGQAHVPGEDGRADPEVGGVRGPPGVAVQGLENAVHTGLAAARVRAVQDVVVDQRRGLEKFEGRRGGHGDVVRHGPASRAPAPVAQQCAQALAAAREVLDRVHEHGRVRGDRGDPFAFPREELGDPLVQERGEVTVLLRRGDGRVGRGHARAPLIEGMLSAALRGTAGRGGRHGHGLDDAGPPRGRPTSLTGRGAADAYRCRPVERPGAGQVRGAVARVRVGAPS